MPQRKIPMRRCVGCGESKPKGELLRIVRTSEGAVETDPTGRKNGRGAYICRSEDCVKKLKKSQRLQYAFHVPVPPEFYDSVLEELKNEQ